MLETADGKRIKVGAWVQDTTGIYEVISISARKVDLVEVYFTDDKGGYILTAERRLTPAEACKLYSF